MKFALLALLTGAFVIAIPAYAHHSFGAFYSEQETVTVEGTISAFLYRNPHSFVDVDTVDEHGNVTMWAAEWFGSGRLSRIGVNPETFKTGDHVIITGAPSRNANEHRVHLKTISRPSDGLKIERYQRGNR